MTTILRLIINVEFKMIVSPKTGYMIYIFYYRKVFQVLNLVMNKKVLNLICLNDPMKLLLNYFFFSGTLISNTHAMFSYEALDITEITNYKLNIV